jgi:inward rectifier potassium channel
VNQAEKRKRAQDPRDPANAIRLGYDSSPLSDLYYAMLEASWAKLGVLLVLAYFTANLVFAGLYASCGDCIEAVEPGSFSDAFFFSVQTISTIGYGHLYPRTNFAEAIVTIESLCGLIGFALVTGLVFSKFSLPSARVLFSEPFLISNYDGKRTLMFRLANARGNDIVEASLRISVLLPEVSSDGHALRRLHDLKLTRSRSPLFVMSWLVFHVIDEDSPIYGIKPADFAEKGIMMICSLTGLDGTFNSTVHTRHIYRPESLYTDHLFEDVIENDEQGRLVLNLHKFHKVRPVEPTGTTAGEPQSDASPSAPAR